MGVDILKCPYCGKENDVHLSGQEYVKGPFPKEHVIGEMLYGTSNYELIRCRECGMGFFYIMKESVEQKEEREIVEPVIR